MWPYKTTCQAGSSVAEGPPKRRPRPGLPTGAPGHGLQAEEPRPGFLGRAGGREISLLIISLHRLPEWEGFSGKIWRRHLQSSRRT